MARWEMYRQGEKVVVERKHPIMTGFVLHLTAVCAVSLIGQAPWLLAMLPAYLVVRLGMGRGLASRGFRD